MNARTPTVPEFSPAMLRLMLEGRAVLARADSGLTQKQFAAQLAKLAGVDRRLVGYAMSGRLRKADARTRLWAVIGHFPSDFGIVLMDKGGQQHG
jgi:hypothetical protein